MVPFDMTVSFVAGQTLALSARKQLKEEKSYLFNRPMIISLLWMVLLYTPSAMFFYHGWTAWNIMYIFDPYPPPTMEPTLSSSVLIWLDSTVLTLILIGGFALGHYWIKRERAKLTIIVPAIAAIALIAAFFIITIQIFQLILATLIVLFLIFNAMIMCANQLFRCAVYYYAVTGEVIAGFDEMVLKEIYV